MQIGHSLESSTWFMIISFPAQPHMHNNVLLQEIVQIVFCVAPNNEFGMPGWNILELNWFITHSISMEWCNLMGVYKTVTRRIYISYLGMHSCKAHFIWWTHLETCFSSLQATCFLDSTQRTTATDNIVVGLSYLLCSVCDLGKNLNSCSLGKALSPPPPRRYGKRLDYKLDVPFLIWAKW